MKIVQIMSFHYFLINVNTFFLPYNNINSKFNTKKHGQF